MGTVLDLLDTSSALIAFALFLITMIVTQQVLVFRSEIGTNPPPSGPREWPVIGCMLSLIGDEPYRLLANMSLKYGAVFRTRIGMIPTIIVNDFESMREVFARSGDDFADRPNFGLMQYITKGRGIISAHVGDSQREKRRFGLSALRELGMGKSKLVENIIDEIDVLSDVFRRRNGEPFVPFHDITVSVSNIISWIVFGKRFKHDDRYYDRFLEIIHEGIEICEGTGVVGFIPVLQYLPLPVWKKLADNDKEWKEFDSVMIKEALNRPESEQPCFVQMYVAEMKRMQAQAAGKKTASSSLANGADETSAGTPDEAPIFNEDDLRQSLGDLFAAGTDTTATTLKWAILYMVLHPEIQDKIHEELDNAIGRDRMPSLDERKAIPYTEAVLMEVQRKATIVPLSVPHAASRDAQLLGYDVPAGTLILPNIWAAHHDPKVWDKPDEFIPERFLNEQRSAVVQRDELVPFCTGRRKCLGEQLAKMELFFFFTHLLHRFQFRLPEGAPPPSTVGIPGATRNPLEYRVCAIPRTQ